MQIVKDYLDKNQESFLDQLKDFLKISSISAEDAYKGDMKIARDFLKEKFLKMNYEVEEYAEPTERHPLIYAKKIVDPALPTVILYGHYDVQPVEPLDEWDLPPFEPSVKDGYIYGRGTSDDKGQFLVYLSVLQAFNETNTDLPVNVKVIVEGEEESSGETINKFIEKNKDELKADVLLLSDSGMYGKDKPGLLFSLRGVYAATIKLETATSDAHSGGYGGLLPNPLFTLSKLLSGLKDENENITIPNFYDDVEPLSDVEKENLEKLNFDKSEFLKEVGAYGSIGDDSKSDLERLWLWPTLDINGLWGGYNVEKGFKTVIPYKAYAKVSMRLTSKQDPKKIEESFIKYLKDKCPSYAKIDIRTEGVGAPLKLDISSKVYQETCRILGEVFPNDGVFLGCGGSIPVVSTFHDVLGVDCLLLGLGFDSDNTHAPNEHFYLDNFYKGMDVVLRLFYKFNEIIKK